MQPENKAPSSSLKKELIDWLIAIVVAVIVAVFITQVVIVNAEVPSESMENTIITGDRVLGLRPSYWFNVPKRGDIIIFRFPDDEEVLFVKRVVGLPGETVELREGKVYINGSSVALDEPYLKEPPRTSTMEASGTYVVPEGHYFVMGDNRNNSNDSRYWNNTFVAEDKIIGRAWLRVYPNPGVLK
ncbi:signal peptidase I [Ruminococcaceae bacterium OttesenSCG-928-A16]|nr:signal peptidase I [Ruminococcaceae bacterium OttesenSCG-928-A16]